MSTGGVLAIPRCVWEVLLFRSVDGGAPVQRSKEVGQHHSGNGTRTQVCPATESSRCVYLIFGKGTLLELDFAYFGVSPKL